jgi:hypothetical protein
MVLTFKVNQKKILSKINLNLKIMNQLTTHLTFSSFTELSDILGMDKGSLYENHMYTEIYEKYLNKFINDRLTMIEIGVHDSRFPGRCLHFWDKLFPNLEYYGIDIVDTSNLEYNKEKIKLFKCDQNNKEDLLLIIKNKNLSGKLDLIIDDGSHVSEHIINTFTTLFPHIKNGGYYFIEDLHAGCALREITIKEIKNYLEYNFPVNYEINFFGIKLMLITKLG